MPDPISWEFAWPYLMAALAGGYLAGSVPFGLLITRLAGLGDVRKIGSGNIGATNVLRTGRKDLAAATLLLDIAKGAVVVAVAQLYGPDTALMAALGAVVGHLLPVWLRFKGGKGVATSFGVMLALAWPIALGGCLTWLAVVALVRISSAAALAATALSPVFAWLFTADLQMVQMTAILAALIWVRHAANIVRLLKGQEPKIGGKT